MTGIKALIDSNVLIYLSKRELPLSFLDKFDDISISVITYMEILGYTFQNKEEEIFIRDLISIFDIIYIDQEITDIVIDIRKKKRIKLPDAIIAATALSKNLIFITRNISDFQDINIKILNPFD